MNLTKYKLGDLIVQRREKNNNYDVPIRGVSKEGFIPAKQKDVDTSIYNVFISTTLCLTLLEWN